MCNCIIKYQVHECNQLPLQYTITTRKMMALVSELSMQQVSTYAYMYIQYVCKYVCMYTRSMSYIVCVCVYLYVIALSVLVKYTYSVLFCAVEVHSTAVHIPSAPPFSPIPSLDALQVTAHQLQ